jgi:hypothetical protein
MRYGVSVFVGCEDYCQSISDLGRRFDSMGLVAFLAIESPGGNRVTCS